MSSWEYLAYAEAADTNKKLDEISEQNEYYRASQKKSRLENDLNYLFQALHKAQGDVSGINLAAVENLKQDMNSGYRSIFNHQKAEKNVLYPILIGFISLIAIAGYAISKSDSVVIIPFMLILYFIYKMSEIKNRIRHYEEAVRNKTGEVHRTKLHYPDLTSFGLYAKYYIDRKTREVLNLLLEQGKDDESVYLARKAVYKLFGFESDPRIENLQHVLSWNNDLMRLYDNITYEEAHARVN